MKRIIISIMLMITVMTSLSATPSIKTTLNLEYSYDTNVLSEPLPKFDPSGNWLKWKADHPFIKKHSIGISFTLDFFFNEIDRTGISTAVAAKIPIATTTIRPVAEKPGDFKGDWNYEEADSSENQKTAVFGSIGPVFRAHLGIADIGCAIRLSIGRYDYIENEVIIGLQAEPFADFYLTEDLFFNIRFTYDAHLMRFIDHPTYKYEQHYQMVTLAPSIGIGYRF